MDPIKSVLLAIAALVCVISGVSILVSIYNSMSDRQHEIAVMRALGASRSAVMSIILVESILLALLGGVAGVLLGHATLALAAPSIEAHAGITIHFWHFSWQEALLIPGSPSSSVRVCGSEPQRKHNQASWQTSQDLA